MMRWLTALLIRLTGRKYMDAKTALEIQSASFKSAQDIVRAQVAAGKPNKGMTKQRHMAVVADVAVEMLESFGNAEDTKLNREVLRAAFSGSLLNASALRQELEGKGGREVILMKDDTVLSDEYGV